MRYIIDFDLDDPTLQCLNRFIGSVQLFLAFFLSLVAGKLTDMGYYRFIVHPGSALFAIWYFNLEILLLMILLTCLVA